MFHTMLVTMLILSIPGAEDARFPELAEPVRIEADGQPIDTLIGHAAPFVCDFNGDGVKDLLVGQFGGGNCTIYLNKGSDAAPDLAAGVKFKAGEEDGSVPSG